MCDVHDKQNRSYNMSQIKSKDTKPELLVRNFLFANGFRYRLHVKELPGKPDIVLPKYKTVIFVNGCFWHGHKNCKYFKLPSTRSEWWKNKIEKTINQDLENCRLLIKSGWKTISLFECQLKSNKKDSTLNELKTNIY